MSSEAGDSTDECDASSASIATPMAPQRRLVRSRRDELTEARLRSPSSPEEDGPLWKHRRLEREEDAKMFSLFRAVSFAIKTASSDEDLARLLHLLRNSDVDLNAEWSVLGGRTVLQYACTGVSPWRDAVISLLLEAGARATVIDSGRNGVLHDAIFHHASCSLIRMLLAKGCDPDAANETGHTAVHFACMFGAVDNLELLLRTGGSSNAKALHGMRPLHHAALRQSPEHCELLIAYGAEPDSETDEGMTALSLALSRGSISVVCALLSNGARPTKGDFALAQLHRMQAELYRACGRHMVRQHQDGGDVHIQMKKLL